MKRPLLIFFLSIVILFFIGFIWFSINFIKKTSAKSADDPRIALTTIPAAYSNVFPLIDSLKFLVGDKSKFRNPSVTLGYGKKYNVELYKLTNSDLPSLNSVITIIHRPFKMNMEAGYYSSFADNPPLTVAYQIGRPEPLKHIYLSLDGTGYKVILRSDSIASFYSNVKSGYLKYSLKSIEEIVIKPNNDDKKEVPAEITFYQTKTGLYLIVLYPQNQGGQIPPRSTLKLIKGLAVASL